MIQLKNPAINRMAHQTNQVQKKAARQKTLNSLKEAAPINSDRRFSFLCYFSLFSFVYVYQIRIFPFILEECEDAEKGRTME